MTQVFLHCFAVAGFRGVLAFRAQLEMKSKLQKLQARKSGFDFGGSVVLKPRFFLEEFSWGRYFLIFKKIFCVFFWCSYGFYVGLSFFYASVLLCCDCLRGVSDPGASHSPSSFLQVQIRNAQEEPKDTKAFEQKARGGRNFCFGVESLHLRRKQGQTHGEKRRR